MNESDNDDNLDQTIRELQHTKAELSFLFGEDTVELASQIDIADLNLQDHIIKTIAEGLGELKK